MKDAQWAETNEIFLIFAILSFRVMVDFVVKNDRKICRKSTIPQKIKNRKFIFHSFQHNPLLSCKFENFWNLFVHGSIWLKIYIFLEEGFALTPPTGAAPLSPHTFGLRTLASLVSTNGIFPKISSVFCMHEVTYIRIDHTQNRPYLKN